MKPWWNNYRFSKISLFRTTISLPWVCIPRQIQSHQIIVNNLYQLRMPTVCFAFYCLKSISLKYKNKFSNINLVPVPQISNAAPKTTYDRDSANWQAPKRGTYARKKTYGGNRGRTRYNKPRGKIGKTYAAKANSQTSTGSYRYVFLYRHFIVSLGDSLRLSPT